MLTNKKESKEELEAKHDKKIDEYNEKIKRRDAIEKRYYEEDW